MMDRATHLTRLTVEEKLTVGNLTADEKVTAASAEAAAGDAPTKAEFDALVVLANANKAAINALLDQLM